LTRTLSDLWFDPSTSGGCGLFGQLQHVRDARVPGHGLSGLWWQDAVRVDLALEPFQERFRTG
jgi:hypothetical protein